MQCPRSILVGRHVQASLIHMPAFSKQCRHDLRVVWPPETAADEAHRQFIEARNNASAKHEEFKAILSDIHVINKKLGSNKPKRRKSDNKSSSGANKNREEKERAEEIFEKFKQGGKLSTEELLLLQKYNIN